MELESNLTLYKTVVPIATDLLYSNYVILSSRKPNGQYKANKKLLIIRCIFLSWLSTRKGNSYSLSTSCTHAAVFLSLFLDWMK